MFAQLAQRLGFQFTPAPGHQNPGGSPGAHDPDADPTTLLERAIAPLVQPLLKDLNELRTTVTRQAEGASAQRLTAADQVVQQFRTDPAHKYYDNVEQTIGDLLERGVVPRTGNFAADLAKAYEAACWQHPEIREALINERAHKTQDDAQRAAAEATARAKRASKSVTGAPAPGAKEPPRGGAGALKGDAKLRAFAEQAYDQAAATV